MPIVIRSALGRNNGDQVDSLTPRLRLCPVRQKRRESFLPCASEIFVRRSKLFVALVFLWLLAGCATKGGWYVATIAEASGAKKEERVTDRQLERRAEALAHFGLGVMAQAEGDQATARWEFEKSLQADPDHEALTVDLVRDYLRSGDLEKAFQLLRRSAKQRIPWSALSAEGADQRSSQGV